jgi:hypothetical protein
MKAIRRACQIVAVQVYKHSKKDIELGETWNGTDNQLYEPKITFIAVQKRHKTRFFCQNSADGVGRVLLISPLANLVLYLRR